MGWGIQSMRMCRRWGRGGGGGCTETPLRARSVFDYILWLSVFAQFVADATTACYTVADATTYRRACVSKVGPPPTL